jgi:hypothetical protein
MRNIEAEDQLLIDCEPYFLDGVITIAEIVRRTQRTVSDAVERHRSALVKAMGFLEDDISVVDYFSPDKLQKAIPEQSVFVGVKLKASAVAETALFRYWGSGTDGAGIGAYIWIKGRQNMDRLATAINDLPDEPEPKQSWSYETGSDGSYWIFRVLGASEIPEINARLSELITFCIQWLTAVGGARHFLN